MIAELWKRLDRHSRPQGFNLLAELNGPATSGDLAALTAMPWTIPEALLESLRLHDGERDSYRGSPLFGGSRLLSAAEMLSQREETLEALLDMVEAADPEAEYDLPIGIGIGIGPVRAQPCHPDWLPFLSMCARVNFYLDFAPLEGGVSGQIIRVDVETGENVVCANSFSEFLAAYVAAVEGGQFKLGKHGLQWSEPWPELAALPWLQPTLLDASRIDAVGRASSWGRALKLARDVLTGPELLRVRARARAEAGKPRLALAALDEIRSANAESEDDLELRLELLQQRGDSSEQMLELERALARNPRPQWYVRRARLHQELAQTPPQKMSAGRAMSWAASPAGQQHAAVCMERAFDDWTAALELEPRCRWRLKLADALLGCERWAEAEQAYAEVIRQIEAMPQADAASRQRLVEAQEGLQRAQQQESDGDSNEETLGSLNDLLQSLRELSGNDLGNAQIEELQEVRDTFSNLLQLETEQRSAETDESLDADAQNIAGQLARRYQQSAVRMQLYASPEGDPAAERFYRRSERILSELGYDLLGDYELLNHTEMSGQSVRMRILLAADRESMAAIWRLPGPFTAFEVIELESKLQDGRILITTNTGAANPFEPPALIESQVFPAGTAIKLLYRSHQQRILQTSSAWVPIADIEAVVALQEHQRQLLLEHGRRIGGVSDRELRGLLGASYSRLAVRVRQHLAKLLGAT